METIYKEVRAKVYFLSPEEGGRRRNVDLTNPRFPWYELAADFGFGYTEDGIKIMCMARARLEHGPGFIELGVEQTVRLVLTCPEHVFPGARFELAEGTKVVAKGTVISIRD